MFGLVTRYAFALAALLLALLILLWIASRYASSVPQAAVAPARNFSPAPHLTPARTVAGIGNKAFSLLVSYTDQGFEPKAASVKKGDTVRFTNNSTHAMNLSLPGAPADLPPGEYWEYTLAIGDVVFREKARGTTGVFHVR